MINLLLAMAPCICYLYTAILYISLTSPSTTSAVCRVFHHVEGEKSRRAVVVAAAAKPVFFCAAGRRCLQRAACSDSGQRETNIHAA